MTKRFLLLLGVVLCCAAVATAQNSPVDLFQLDGNAAHSPTASPGVFPSYPFPAATPDVCTYVNPSGPNFTKTCEFWNQLNGAGGPGVITGTGTPGVDGWGVRTFVNGVNDELNFQGGGSKDPKDIPNWKYTDTNTPPKDGLRHGYAATYTALNGDFEIIFGANRASPNGDANIGIWFFQQTVATNGSGGFTGVHVLHDVFVISGFTNGGGTSTVSTYEWNPACSAANYPGFDPATSAPGSCAATNLRFLSSVSAGGSCTETSPDCGKTNPVTTHTTWDGDLISPVFFEGGVDITAAFTAAGITDLPCFSSFLMETRSSQSPSSVLKDFLLGGFPVCGMAVAKQCATCVLANQGQAFSWDVGGTVRNTGVGTLYNVTVVDDAGTSSTTSDDLTFNCGSLTKGQTKKWGAGAGVGDCTDATGHSVTSTTQNPITNGASASGQTAQSGGTTVSASTSQQCGQCTTNPALGVGKTCTTSVQVVGNVVEVKVDFTGSVTNNGDEALTNVNVSEDNNADSTVDVTSLVLTKNNAACGSPCVLLPAESASFSGSYFPNNFAAVAAGRARFSDTVKATATGVLDNLPVAPQSKTAACLLCPIGACPTTIP